MQSRTLVILDPELRRQVRRGRTAEVWLPVPPAQGWLRVQRSCIRRRNGSAGLREETLGEARLQEGCGLAQSGGEHRTRETETAKARVRRGPRVWAGKRRGPGAPAEIIGSNVTLALPGFWPPPLILGPCSLTGRADPCSHLCPLPHHSPLSLRPGQARVLPISL